jgi:hypothetical protein
LAIEEARAHFSLWCIMAARVSDTDLGLKSTAISIRDLWKQEDLGTFPQAFSTKVPAKAAVLIKAVPQR